MQNPEKIEIEGLKTIHKLCKFGADHNMEGCSFTEIVERMFDKLAKAQAVPEVITIGNELQSWVAVWSFSAKNDGEDYVVVDANLLAEKIEGITGANG